MSISNVNTVQKPYYYADEVAAVVPDSPAQAAGLKTNDIVLQADYENLLGEAN
jgi:C-terminal processing protease CtpA/Prc